MNEPRAARIAGVIRLEDVVKRYRQGQTQINAIDGVTFEIPAGQFVSVMGPSGSGKSSLLHLIGGLDVPDEGSIRVGPHDLAALGDRDLTIFRRRHVGFVFQFFNLLPTLTAGENVALPLLLDGRPRREASDQAAAVLEQVGLADRRHHRPDALSGGEMQRVAIARALVARPMLLLADEPTGNLDTHTGEEVLELIRRTATETGQTVVMVTHDARAAAYGDRVVSLEDGRIVDDTLADGAATAGERA